MTTRPPRCSMTSSLASRSRRIATCISSGSSLHRPSGISHLGGEEGDHALQVLGSTRVAQLLDEPSRRALASSRVDREPGPEDACELALLVGVDAGIGRCRVGGWLTVEEGDRGGRQPVHVGGRVRLLTGGHLGGHVADGPEPALAGVRARDVEVDEHDAALRGAHDVGGLHVTVDDGRFMPMQVVERVGDLRQVVDHVLEREPRVALLLEHLLEVRAVDPVHDHHVAGAVMGEEVAPHHRQPRVRLDAHEQPGLGEELVPVHVGDRVHLERDQPVVHLVERLEHRRAPPLAHRSQHLVPRAEELVVSHARRLRRDDDPRGRRW